MSYVPKILIVDDDFNMCKSLQVLLDNGGYEIHTRHNGRQALEALVKNHFDLVLLDFILPDLTGAEVMDYISKHIPETLVIVITGHASPQSAIDSLRKGAFDYLRKPFEHEELSRTVKNALDQKALRREHKRVQAALRESEERFRLAFENAKDAIFWADPETALITNCNRAAETLLEKTKEQIIGTHHTTLYPPGKAQHYESMFKQHLETKGAVDDEAEVITKSGEAIPVHITASVTLVGGKAITQEVFRNISEHKGAEEALLRAKEDWENTFDAITDMVMLLDDKHQIFRANRAAAEALNTSKEGLVGKKCYEAIHQRSQPLGKCPLKLTMKTLEAHTAEITEPHLGGTFICSTSPILDREGKLIGYTHSLKDITGAKRLEAQFHQAQRLEAIGTLAGGIAHDFNNLLMGIQGHVSLALMDIDPTHSHYERLKKIEKQVESGARLTSHLLGYARKGRYEVKPTDLNQLVEDTSETFGRTKKEITIHRELAEDLFAIEADAGQIEQVLLNLFVNAADAMPGGGDLIVKTMNVTHKNMGHKPYDPKPGNYVYLTVTDTGRGMDKETMERVFEPFFTTKEMGRGTGLGLASAYGIVKAHGGYIDVDSKKGHGATFGIHLPSTDRRVREAAKTADGIVKAAGTVLLVDDEDNVLEVDQELLEAMGYRVLVAKDGIEAVEVYRKHQDDIDLVVLDMIMPGMGGGEAYDRMKQINPHIKVLLSSGFSIDGEASDILERGCDGFIQKPFRMKELSEKIREILDKR